MKGSEKAMIALGTALLVLWGFATVYGLSADSDRRVDSEDAKKQLRNTLAASLDKQSIHHETTSREHQEISKRLDKIETAVKQRQDEVARLVKQAEYHVKTLREQPANSEVFGRSLHSAANWNSAFTTVTGIPARAPRATEGSKPVIDFYCSRISEVPEYLR